MGSFKLQLLDLAVGSLPYPGNYLDFQFVSPGRDRPLCRFPICKPCLDVRHNPLRIPTLLRRPITKKKVWDSNLCLCFLNSVLTSLKEKNNTFEYGAPDGKAILTFAFLRIETIFLKNMIFH